MTQSRFARKLLVPMLVVCGAAGAGLAIAGGSADDVVQKPATPLVIANAGSFGATVIGEARSTLANAAPASAPSLSARMNTAVDDARRVAHALAVSNSVGRDSARQDALLEADLVNVPEALREPSAAALLAAGFVSMLVIVRQRLKR